jgi:hypothetical protein
MVSCCARANFDYSRVPPSVYAACSPHCTWGYFEDEQPRWQTVALLSRRTRNPSQTG